MSAKIASTLLVISILSKLRTACWPSSPPRSREGELKGVGVSKGDDSLTSVDERLLMTNAPPGVTVEIKPGSAHP